MPRFFTSPAIVLSRRAYSDFDLIVTVMSRDYGKRTLMAKAAKKSIKRFSGGLEPFSQLQIVCRQGRGRGMLLLEESNLEQAFTTIRTDVLKTAYASYWAQLISLWHEEGQAHSDVYHLLARVFADLNCDIQSDAVLHVLFQLRFIGQEGFGPILVQCTECQIGIDGIGEQKVCFDVKQGGIVCSHCRKGSDQTIRLSKGTVKQLQWLMDKDLSVAQRVRLSPQAVLEATEFLEIFVPFHIGKTPKSLTFLRQMRAAATKPAPFVKEA